MLLAILLGLLSLFFFYCGFIAIGDKKASIGAKTFLAAILWGVAIALAYAVRAL